MFLLHYSLHYTNNYLFRMIARQKSIREWPLVRCDAKEFGGGGGGRRLRDLSSSPTPAGTSELRWPTLALALALTTANDVRLAGAALADWPACWPPPAAHPAPHGPRRGVTHVMGSCSCTTSMQCTSTSFTSSSLSSVSFYTRTSWNRYHWFAIHN